MAAHTRALSRRQMVALATDCTLLTVQASDRCNALNELVLFTLAKWQDNNDFIQRKT